MLKSPAAMKLRPLPWASKAMILSSFLLTSARPCRASFKLKSNLSARSRLLTRDSLKKLNLLLFPDVYYSPAFYKDVLASGFYSRLAYIDENPVGMIGCSIEVEEGDGEQFDLVIMTIGVLAQYRSEGVGSLMMRHILNVATHDDRIRSIYLHVKVRVHPVAIMML